MAEDRADARTVVVEDFHRTYGSDDMAVHALHGVSFGLRRRVAVPGAGVRGPGAGAGGRPDRPGD